MWPCAHARHICLAAGSCDAPVGVSEQLQSRTPSAPAEWWLPGLFSTEQTWHTVTETFRKIVVKKEVMLAFPEERCCMESQRGEEEYASLLTSTQVDWPWFF